MCDFIELNTNTDKYVFYKELKYKALLYFDWIVQTVDRENWFLLRQVTKELNVLLFFPRLNVKNLRWVDLGGEWNQII